MARPQAADGGTALIWRVAAYIFNNYSRTADKERSLSLDLDEYVTTTHHRYLPFYERFSVPSDMD